MAITGETIVTSAGTIVPLVAAPQMVNCAVMIKALHTNTDLVGVCDPGVDLDNGLQLSKDEAIIYDFVGNLASIWIDAAVNGEGVRWALLTV
jgi:hypothetical protein